MAGSALVGMSGLGNMRAGLKTVYEDRAIPLGQLADVRSGYYEIRIAVIGAVNANNSDVARQRESDIEKIRKEIERTWKAYAATMMTPEEDRLVKDAIDAIEAYDDARSSVLAAVMAGRADEARSLAAGGGAKTFGDMMEVFSQLTTLQVEVAREEYEKANSTYESEFSLSVGALIAAVLVVGGALIIARSVTTPLTAMIGVMQEMTRGNLRVTVTGQAGAMSWGQ